MSGFYAGSIPAASTKVGGKLKFYLQVYQNYSDGIILHFTDEYSRGLIIKNLPEGQAHYRTWEEDTIGNISGIKYSED